MASYIELTKGKRAVVDDALFGELSKWKWHTQEVSGLFYAARNKRLEDGRVRLAYMHREVASLANLGDAESIDHRDGDGLNNQVNNLRPCLQSENRRNNRLAKNNTTGFKGVHRRKGRRGYRAEIKVNRVNHYLGTYGTAEQAAAAYDAAAKILHGEFARTNS